MYSCFVHPLVSLYPLNQYAWVKSHLRVKLSWKNVLGNATAEGFMGPICTLSFSKFAAALFTTKRSFKGNKSIQFRHFLVAVCK